MLSEFKEGKEYVKELVKQYSAMHIPIAERWRENRFAYIAFVNAPFVFQLIKPFEDIINLLCWISIVALSIKKLTIRNFYDGNRVDFSRSNLYFYRTALFETTNIEEQDHNEQRHWYQDYIYPFKKQEDYEKTTNQSVNEEIRRIADKKMVKINRWIIGFFLITVLNQSLKVFHNHMDLLPNWLQSLISFQNFSPISAFIFITILVILVSEIFSARVSVDDVQSFNNSDESLKGKLHNVFEPIHPGLILKDFMENHDWSIDMLVEKSGLSVEVVQQLFSESTDISEDISIKLGKTFKMEARYFIRLQEFYENNLKEREQQVNTVTE